MEKKFTWVSQNLSYLEDNTCYSRPFTVAGCNWRLLACPKGDRDDDGHLSLYLELADPASLPPGWNRDVRFSLTLVNKGWGRPNKVLGAQRCFDAKNTIWGFEEFLPLFKLFDWRERFLVNFRLVIIAELVVFPAIEHLSCKVGNQSAYASLSRSQGDSSCQVVANASKENLQDDDGTSEESSDDRDASQENLDDDDDDDDDDDGISSDSVAAETEVSNGENAPKEDVDDDEASSLVLHTNKSSLDQVKSLVENDGLKEIQSVKETMDVNGFEVFSSQVESVSHIFKRHPDIALGFRPKNRKIRRAYMNELLSLIETLCQSAEKLSEDDLSNAGDTLVDLIDVGFKLDWLKAKLNEVSEKKKMEQGSLARIQTMEEQVQKMKLMFLDLATQLHKEKAEALVSKAPLSFNDVVC